jgi:hypothetical protein
VKEIALNGGPLDKFIPAAIQADLIKKITERKTP